MRPTFNGLARVVIAACSLAVLPAAAQVEVDVRVHVPTVTFSVAPALVVVSPGIRVVPEYEHEVFFVSGVYWMRHEGHWFRAPRHDAGWVKVKHTGVPAGLRKLAPGKYKHYKHAVKGESRGRVKFEADRPKHKSKGKKKHQKKGHKRD